VCSALSHCSLISFNIRDKITFLSLNRFERKKNAALAIQAFGALPGSKSDTMRLVLAGGYDPRLVDNVECLAGLLSLCNEMGLGWEVVSPNGVPDIPLPEDKSSNGAGKQVLFVLNFSNTQRTHLLTAPSTRALLYTPQNEHFGIVPVEAMVCGLPVVACDSGGPMESIVDPNKVGPGNGGGKRMKSTRTGYLVPPTPSLWTQVLLSVLELAPEARTAMADAARIRVKTMFSLESMTQGIEGALVTAVGMGSVRGIKLGEMLVGFVGLGLGFWLVK
jgi:alpha-1,3/alpha-1,6-mannosyltransferase